MYQEVPSHKQNQSQRQLVIVPCSNKLQLKRLCWGIWLWFLQLLPSRIPKEVFYTPSYLIEFSISSRRDHLG